MAAVAGVALRELGYRVVGGRVVRVEEGVAAHHEHAHDAAEDALKVVEAEDRVGVAEDGDQLVEVAAVGADARQAREQQLGLDLLGEGVGVLFGICVDIADFDAVPNADRLDGCHGLAVVLLDVGERGGADNALDFCSVQALTCAGTPLEELNECVDVGAVVDAAGEGVEIAYDRSVVGDVEDDVSAVALEAPALQRHGGDEVVGVVDVEHGAASSAASRGHCRACEGVGLHGGKGMAGSGAVAVGTHGQSRGRGCQGALLVLGAEDVGDGCSAGVAGDEQGLVGARNLLHVGGQHAVDAGGCHIEALVVGCVLPVGMVTLVIGIAHVEVALPLGLGAVGALDGEQIGIDCLGRVVLVLNCDQLVRHDDSGDVVLVLGIGAVLEPHVLDVLKAVVGQELGAWCGACTSSCDSSSACACP